MYRFFESAKQPTTMERDGVKKVKEETIDKAIWAHSRWKLHLQNAINNGKSEFSVAETRNPMLCKFGEWLYSVEGKTLPNFAEIVELHQQFHQEAGKILALVLSGQIEDAKAKMESGSDFNQLTAKLVKMLSELKKKL